MIKKKQPYVSPQTVLTCVELENPICSGSVIDENVERNAGITTTSTPINTDFGTGNDFSSGNWDDINTTN